MYYAITFDDVKLLFGFASLFLITWGTLVGLTNLIYFLYKKSTLMAATTNVQGK